jgi:hypothetical protein
MGFGLGARIKLVHSRILFIIPNLMKKLSRQKQNLPFLDDPSPSVLHTSKHSVSSFEEILRPNVRDVVAAEVEFVEMNLLPWVYDDKLFAAFEKGEEGVRVDKISMQWIRRRRRRTPEEFIFVVKGHLR